MKLLTTHKLLAAAVIAGSLSIPLWKSQAQSDVSRERKEYADKIRENYNFRFWK